MEDGQNVGLGTGLLRVEVKDEEKLISLLIYIYIYIL